MHARIHEEFQLLQHIMAVAEFNKKVVLYPNLTILISPAGTVFAWHGQTLSVMTLRTFVRWVLQRWW